MCKNAISYSFAVDTFTADVFARENMSSTAYQNVAVPHSLGNSAKKSFISVALYKDGLQWDTKSVQLVLLLGVDSETRKLFSQIFDGLIEVITNTNCLSELIACEDYNSFIDKLAKFMDELELL